MEQTSIKNQSKMDQTSIKNRPKSRSGGLRGRFGGLLGRLGRSKASLEASWTVLEASWRGLGGLLGSLWLRKVANMAPTWSPKRSQNREKIEAKIDQNFDGSWGRIFEGFWWIWEAKMEPSWHKSGVKNRCQLRKAFFHETHSRCSGGSFCRIKRVEVGSKNGPKIDEKMRST